MWYVAAHDVLCGYELIQLKSTYPTWAHPLPPSLIDSFNLLFFCFGLCTNDENHRMTEKQPFFYC